MNKKISKLNNSYQSAWDKSYKHKDNHMFYPHEDVIRFVTKYIRKKIGVDSFVDQCNFTSVPKVLDFGCGIGRHVKLLYEYNLDVEGFDLSQDAIAIAKENFKKQGLYELVDKVIVANVLELPYETSYFDFMVSHAVLDSMPFSVAKTGMQELSRCLKNNGRIYLDLISSDINVSNGSTDDEIVVKNEFEKNTVQSFYNMKKIEDLMSGHFVIEEIVLKTKSDISNNILAGRYHLVLKKI